MEIKNRSSSLFPRQKHIMKRLLCVLGLICLSFFGIAFGTHMTYASEPGGNVSDPVVRQVDIARPAVVRIITTLRGRVTVRFAPTQQVATFPLDGTTYAVELSGTGAFISAHGDILTADHVINPPRDQALNNALYQTAAPDIAQYVNTHFQVMQPFTADQAVFDLESGTFPSETNFNLPTSEVYLSTDYTGPLTGTKIENLPATVHAPVDRIEQQSAVDQNDVAIIHVKGMDDMPSIQLDDSTVVHEQDTLTIIGFPGLGDVSTKPTNLFTSSVNKVFVSSVKTTDAGAPVIQVGGNIEHGDSGGPALDENGHIVGIVSFGLALPNQNGQTSFLQASSSALKLIRNLQLNTTPGAFQQAWTQAFMDYASTAPGHWHKAMQELQTLQNRYTHFQGMASYLTFAQNQASGEQAPQPQSQNNNGGVLVVVLVMIVLVIAGILGFLVLQRRKSNKLAFSGAGMQSLYGKAASMGAASAPQANSATGGLNYTPLHAAREYPAEEAGGALSMAASMPRIPVAPNTPVEYAPIGSPFAQEKLQKQADPAAATPEWAGKNGAQPSPAPYWRSPQTPLGVRRGTPPPFPMPNGTGARPGMPVKRFTGNLGVSSPSHNRIMPTDNPFGLDEEKTSSGLFPAASRPSAIHQQKTLSGIEPETTQQRPTIPEPPKAGNPGQGDVPWNFSYGDVLRVAPCGHLNTGDVRFCRVCGRPIAPAE